MSDDICFRLSPVSEKERHFGVCKKAPGFRHAPRERDRESHFGLCKKAPGFRPAPRVCELPRPVPVVSSWISMRVWDIDVGMGDDSIDTVILGIDMGCIVTLVVALAVGGDDGLRPQLRPQVGPARCCSPHHPTHFEPPTYFEPPFLR
jgi:hypothetical protein